MTPEDKDDIRVAAQMRIATLCASDPELIALDAWEAQALAHLDMAITALLAREGWSLPQVLKKCEDIGADVIAPGSNIVAVDQNGDVFQLTAKAKDVV